jgi:hypothetical protein
VVDEGDPGAVVAGVVVGGNVVAVVVGAAAVVGAAVVAGVVDAVVLVDGDGLLVELHPAPERHITVRPAPTHIHHRCCLIDHRQAQT